MITRAELQKYFHAECKKRYKPLGFTRLKNGYWRIAGDVLQTFSLQFSSSGREGRICFDVYPLCADIQFVVDVGLHYLGQFDPEQLHWSFDKTLYSNPEECLGTTFSMVDSLLIPFFDRATSYRTAFDETLKLDFLFDSIRVQQLGDEDRAEPIETRVYYDSNRFIMALKLHDYEWARKHVQLYLQSTECAYQRALLMEGHDQQWKREYCQRLSNGINRYKIWLQYLSIENSQMIDEHLDLQEQQTRARLMAKPKRKALY